MMRSFQTNDLCLYSLFTFTSSRRSSLHNFRDGIEVMPAIIDGNMCQGCIDQFAALSPFSVPVTVTGAEPYLIFTRH
jgi:hypothetical protein